MIYYNDLFIVVIYLCIAIIYCNDLFRIKPFRIDWFGMIYYNDLFIEVIYWFIVMIFLQLNVTLI